MAFRSPSPDGWPRWLTPALYMIAATGGAVVGRGVMATALCASAGLAAVGVVHGTLVVGDLLDRRRVRSEAPTDSNLRVPLPRPPQR